MPASPHLARITVLEITVEDPCFWISANLGDLSYDSCSSIPRKKLREEEFYLIDGWEIFTYSKEVADARKSLFIACFLKSYCASPLDFGFGSVDLRSPNRLP
ncbi:hypothetical protein HID58_005612 [Brassica napus]|uniref:Uncharacterized protein n=1 Tax=Brassica napus TaxID=3708 RepID=A0ABQ8EBZ2_BRANA|nr:hypothetical protein HID58_005612 [Brassica napus]